MVGMRVKESSVMKKINWLTYFYTLLVIAGLNASAGINPELLTIGFSKDGRYYAFMEVGQSSPSSDNKVNFYAKAKILDVPGNKFVLTTVLSKGRELEVLKDSVLKDKTLVSAVKKFKIKAILFGRRLSTLKNDNVFKLHDHFNASFNNSFNVIPPLPGKSPLYPYDLKLKTFGTSNVVNNAAFKKLCIDEKNLNGALTMQLILVNNAISDDPLTLQSDLKVLPLSRGCVQDYQIQDVILAPQKDPNAPNLMQGGIVVIVKTILPEFVAADGTKTENSSFLVVSGLLNEQP